MFRLIFVFFSLFLSLSAKANQEVYHLVIQGSINPSSGSYFKKNLEKAQKNKMPFLLVELDTPGGLLQTTRDMVQAMESSEIPVVFYVHPSGASATSAGAILTIASHVAVMAPGTNLGAAHPVGNQGDDIKGAMGEKVLQDTAAFVRSLAELRGRPIQLSEEVVTKSKSLTSNEAEEKKLIDFQATDVDDLLKKLDRKKVKVRDKEVVLETYAVALTPVPMTFSEKLLHFLADPNVSALLMSLAMLLIYAEVSSPGVGIPGVLGAIFLILAFISFQVLPIQAGALALVGLGIVMLIAEIFSPTHGILAVGGCLSFVLGLLWLYDPSQTDLQISMMVYVPLALSFSMVALGLTFIGVRFRKQVSEAALARGGSGMLGLEGYEAKIEWVSQDQKTGKALVRGETWDVVSDDVISVGDEVSVLEVVDFKMKVKKKEK